MNCSMMSDMKSWPKQMVTYLSMDTVVLELTKSRKVRCDLKKKSGLFLLILFGTNILYLVCFYIEISFQIKK